MEAEAPARSRLARSTVRDTLGIWALLAVVALAVVVTYARIPLSELYRVSRTGFTGGLSRAVTFLNYPGAFIAIALTGFAVVRLFAAPVALSRPARWLVGVAAAAAVALCASAAFFVDKSNLDARAVNALPVIGLALAAGLTLLAIARSGAGSAGPFRRSDIARAIVVVALLLVSLPWIFADLGFYIGDVPLLGRIFFSRQVPAGDTLVAVHLGHHEGFDGVLFAITGLVLMRDLAAVAWRWARRILGLYLAFMLCYGLINALSDFWLEQVMKRGWSTFKVPDMLMPKLNLDWGLLALATLGVWLVLLYFAERDRARRLEPGGPAQGQRRSSATRRAQVTRRAEMRSHS